MERYCQSCTWKNGWIVTVIDFKGTFASGKVNTIIVSKSSKREPFHLIGLEMIDKNAKVFFDFLVDSFSLTISLGMEGS